MRYIDMKRKTKKEGKKKLESSQPEKCAGHRYWTYLVVIFKMASIWALFKSNGLLSSEVYYFVNTLYPIADILTTVS